MFRNLATSLLQHGQIKTTVQKAKDLRGIVEKLIALGAEDTLARRRKAYAYLKSKDVVHALFVEIGPRYRGRTGGYTQMVRTHHRAGDAAEMCVIQLVAQDAANKMSGKAGMVQGEVVQV